MPRIRNDRSTPLSRTITKLFAALDRAKAAYMAIPDAQKARWLRASDKYYAIAHRIADAHHDAIAEMHDKIRDAAIAARVSYKTDADLEALKPGTGRPYLEREFATLLSLRHDLRKLQDEQRLTTEHVRDLMTKLPAKH